MKKGLLFIVTIIMMVSTIEAKIIEKTGDKLGYNRSLKAQPIVFVEKGIQFSVLPNGKFKFKKANFNNNLRFIHNNWKNKKGVKVLRDRKGRITRVGKVQIFYTRNNKVSQIGSVDLDYQRGKLKKVGNLYVLHKPNGKVKYIGEVKNNRRTYFYKKPVIWT